MPQAHSTTTNITTQSAVNLTIMTVRAQPHSKRVPGPHAAQYWCLLEGAVAGVNGFMDTVEYLAYPYAINGTLSLQPKGQPLSSIAQGSLSLEFALRSFEWLFMMHHRGMERLLGFSGGVE